MSQATSSTTTTTTKSHFGVKNHRGKRESWRATVDIVQYPPRRSLCRFPSSVQNATAAIPPETDRFSPRALQRWQFSLPAIVASREGQQSRLFRKTIRECRTVLYTFDQYGESHGDHVLTCCSYSSMCCPLSGRLGEHSELRGPVGGWITASDAAGGEGRGGGRGGVLICCLP